MHHLASQKTLAEASAQRQVFKPFQQVVEVMQEDPGASQKTLAKDKVAQMDSSAHLQHCRSLTVQGQTARRFQDRAVGPDCTHLTRPCDEVCPKWCDRHPPTQREPEPMGEEDNSQVSALPRETDPSPCAESLQHGSRGAVLQPAA